MKNKQTTTQYFGNFVAKNNQKTKLPKWDETLNSLSCPLFLAHKYVQIFLFFSEHTFFFHLTNILIYILVFWRGPYQAGLGAGSSPSRAGLGWE